MIGDILGAGKERFFHTHTLKSIEMGDKTKGNLRFWRKNKKDNGSIDSGTKKAAKTNMKGKSGRNAATTLNVRHRGKSKAAQMALETGFAPIASRGSGSHQHQLPRTQSSSTHGSTKANTYSGRGLGGSNSNFDYKNNGAGAAQLNHPLIHKGHRAPVTPPSVKNTAKTQKPTSSSTGTSTGIRETISEYNQQPSSVFTPKTMPPTPSPTRTNRKGGHTPRSNEWQETDDEIKIKAMARLHNLAREYAKDIPPGSHSIRSSFEREANTANANGNGNAQNLNRNVKNRTTSTKKKQDQKIIDAVLGINQCACVTTETQTAIKTYASKPTSPATVVNLQMIKRGSFQVFNLAKDTMGKFMNCAADLRDLDDGEKMCAWEQNVDEYVVEDNRSARGRSQAGVSRRMLFSQGDDSSEEDGTFAGVSVKGGESTISHLNSGLSNVSEETGSQDESLGHVMGRLDMNDDARLNAKSSRTSREDTGQRRGRERYRDPVPEYHHDATHGINLGSGATSGLTSFRSLRSGPTRGDNSGSPKPESSSYEVMNADPTTNTLIPFDERSDIYKSVVDNVSYASSVLSSEAGPGLGLQLAESDVYARLAVTDNDHDGYLPLRTGGLRNDGSEREI